MKKMAALAAMAIAFLSCGAPEKSHILPTPMAAHQISAEDSLRYNYFFLEAIRQQNAGRFDAAYDLLRHSIDINHAAPEGWFYLSMYQS